MMGASFFAGRQNPVCARAVLTTGSGRTAWRETLHIRGRSIGESELETVRSFIRAHRSRGRSAISRALCEHWDWRQTNGRLKDRACRVLLLALEGAGEVELPGRIKYNNRCKKAPDGSRYVIPQDEIAARSRIFAL